MGGEQFRIRHCQIWANCVRCPVLPEKRAGFLQGNTGKRKPRACCAIIWRLELQSGEAGDL